MADLWIDRMHSSDSLPPSGLWNIDQLDSEVAMSAQPPEVDGRTLTYGRRDMLRFLGTLPVLGLTGCCSTRYLPDPMIPQKADGLEGGWLKPGPIQKSSLCPSPCVD